MASQDTPLRRNPARIIDKPEPPKNVANTSSHTVVSTAYPQYVVDTGLEVAKQGQHVNLNPDKLTKGTRVWAKFCPNSKSQNWEVYPGTVNYVEFEDDGTLKSIHLLWSDQDKRYTNRNPEQVFFRDLLLEEENPQSPVPVLPVSLQHRTLSPFRQHRGKLAMRTQKRGKYTSRHKNNRRIRPQAQTRIVSLWRKLLQK